MFDTDFTIMINENPKAHEALVRWLVITCIKIVMSFCACIPLIKPNYSVIIR